MASPKAIIFDLDGTLYPAANPLTSELRIITKEWIARRKCLTLSDVESLYRELPKKYPHPYHGFLSLGLTPVEYLKQVFDAVNPEKFLFRDAALEGLLSKTPSTKHVVTLASIGYANRVLAALSIRDSIDSVTSMVDYGPSYHKLIVYEELRRKIGAERNEILIVGDNGPVDIETAKKKGFRTKYISPRSSSVPRAVFFANLFD